MKEITALDNKGIAYFAWEKTMVDDHLDDDWSSIEQSLSEVHQEVQAASLRAQATNVVAGLLQAQAEQKRSDAVRIISAAAAELVRKPRVTTPEAEPPKVTYAQVARGAGATAATHQARR